MCECVLSVECRLGGKRKLRYNCVESIMWLELIDCCCKNIYCWRLESMYNVDEKKRMFETRLIVKIRQMQEVRI